MSAYDGKSFEITFKQLAEKAGCDVIRLYDTMLNYKEVNNPCDFIISKDPLKPAILIECKVCQRSSFPFKNLPQLERLKGLQNFKSYVVIWFTTKEKILAFRPGDISKLIAMGEKSLNPDKTDIPRIDLCKEFSKVNPKSLEMDSLWGVFCI